MHSLGYPVVKSTKRIQIHENPAMMPHAGDEEQAAVIHFLKIMDVGLDVWLSVIVQVHRSRWIPAESSSGAADSAGILKHSD